MWTPFCSLSKRSKRNVYGIYHNIILFIWSDTVKIIDVVYVVGSSLKNKKIGKFDDDFISEASTSIDIHIWSCVVISGQNAKYVVGLKVEFVSSWLGRVIAKSIDGSLYSGVNCGAGAVHDVSTVYTCFRCKSIGDVFLRGTDWIRDRTRRLTGQKKKNRSLPTDRRTR